MIGKLSRREILKRSTAVGAAAATVPVQGLAQASDAFVNLTARESRTLEAIVARLIPSDANGPGAVEAGAAHYIDRALGDALLADRDVYTQGLAAVDTRAQSAFGDSFDQLRTEQQDEVLREIESASAPSPSGFFEMLLRHTIEGTFCDPHYGGNRDFVGWEMIAYPGIRLAVSAEQQRMDANNELSRLSAYDLPMFDRNVEGYDDG